VANVHVFACVGDDSDTVCALSLKCEERTPRDCSKVTSDTNPIYVYVCIHVCVCVCESVCVCVCVFLCVFLGKTRDRESCCKVTCDCIVTCDMMEECVLCVSSRGVAQGSRVAG